MAEVRNSSQQWAGELAARWERLAEELRRRLSPGSALEPEVRVAFESRLGRDLSSATLHGGPMASRLAEMFGAEALAVGTHVVGESARLDPKTTAGAALLGHELTHVIQHSGPPPAAASGGAAVQRAPVSERPGDEEGAAQAVEARLRGEARARGQARGKPVDAEALTERLYRRLMSELLLERDRAAWTG